MSYSSAYVRTIKNHKTVTRKLNYRTCASKITPQLIAFAQIVWHRYTPYFTPERPDTVQDNA